MNETITKEDLRLRRQELQALIIRETEQADIKHREAEIHKANSAAYAARIDEIDLWIKRSVSTRKSENVIPMHRPSRNTGEAKPSLRYRNPGATTDIVTTIYQAPGADFDQVTTTVFEKHRQHGTSRDSIAKMIRRMVREGIASRDGSRLYLTEKGKSAWEASPLYRAS